MTENVFKGRIQIILIGLLRLGLRLREFVVVVRRLSFSSVSQFGKQLMLTLADCQQNEDSKLKPESVQDQEC